MEHLVLSCLESRLEENCSIYGRFLLGPFKVGQGTTIATALRRALLSELRGVAITSVSIRGAAHEYAPIDGVRESALEILLNLRQIVLTGEPSNELPAIGHVSLHGPKVVRAKDLKLPAGLRCVDGDQYIATVSAAGVLCIKLLISAGKGYIVDQPVSDQLPQLGPLEPRLRESRAMTWPLPASDKPVPGASAPRGRAPLDLRHKRALSLSPQRSGGGKDRLGVSGDVQDILRYSYMRRLVTKPLHSSTAAGQQELLHSSGSAARDERFPDPILPLGGVEPNKAQQEVEANRVVASNRVTDPSLPQESEKGKTAKQEDTEHTVGSGEQDRWQRLDQPMWPVEAVFMPVSKVNFLVQRDYQWPRPRERVILEVWTNGSMHPRQAITESATLLVHLFSLFRQAEPLGGGAPSPLAQANQPPLAQANQAAIGYSSRGRDDSNGRNRAMHSMPSGTRGDNEQSRSVGPVVNSGLGRQSSPPARGRKEVSSLIGKGSSRVPRGAYAQYSPEGGDANSNTVSRFTRIAPLGMRRHASLDVGNLKISLQSYVALKKAGIQTLGDLVTGSAGLIGRKDQATTALVSEIREALVGLGLDGAL